jgi:hypothetical protein
MHKIKEIKEEQKRLHRRRVAQTYGPMSLSISRKLGKLLNRLNPLRMAQKIAESQQIKVDRLAKLTKELLIV